MPSNAAVGVAASQDRDGNSTTDLSRRQCASAPQLPEDTEGSPASQSSHPTDLRRAARFTQLSDELRLDVVEQLTPLAASAGLWLTHLAMAFAIAHPGVTSAIIGPRTMQHLDDMLAGADVVLGDDVLAQIDALAPPGTDVSPLDMAYRTPRSSTRRFAAGPLRPRRGLTPAPLAVERRPPFFEPLERDGLRVRCPTAHRQRLLARRCPF